MVCLNYALQNIIDAYSNKWTHNLPITLTEHEVTASPSWFRAWQVYTPESTGYTPSKSRAT